MGQTKAPDGTVLLVDDDVTLLRSIQRLLQQLNLRVETHASPFGVLNRIAELRPDLVMLDVEMPGLEGTDLTTLIRADPELSKVRIILHSGLEDRELSKMALACKADDYISKQRGLATLTLDVVQWLQGNLRFRHLHD